MPNGQTELDRYGCEYGRMLAKDVAHVREDTGEIKTDLKGVVDAIGRIELTLARTGSRGEPSDSQRGNREFWTSIVALATSFVAFAMMLWKSVVKAG